MTNAAFAQVSPKTGHEMLDFEKAAEIASRLKDITRVALEGVDILRGVDPERGDVTLICPGSGQHILLYPFAG